MKTRQKRLLAAVLLTVVLVQLSCIGTEFYDDRTERQKDRDRCEERGGIWHDVPAWCEMPATNTPGPADPGAADANPPAAGLTPTYDISLCDARDVVSVEIILENDSTSAGGRFCWYTLRATNNSTEKVAFYAYENRDDHEGETEPRWWLTYLDPGETSDLPAHGTFLTNGQWSYTYIERAAAVYYNDYCGYRGLGIDYNDEAGTAEPFAWDVDEVYCRQ